MAKSLHCEDYDNLLQNDLIHLVHYPELLPFIGNEWNNQKTKILFIAESHYLAETSSGKSSSETWYENVSSKLTKLDFQHMDTRKVINVADDYAFSKNGYVKAYSIFYNMKSAIFEILCMKDTRRTLFQHFAFYNYFQRPAENTGLSIVNSEKDDKIAYETIKVIVEHTKPTAIIFVSKKAYNSFRIWKRKKNDKIFSVLPVHHVPHPASPSWNKICKSYDNISGRTKFMKLIKALNLQIA